MTKHDLMPHEGETFRLRDSWRLFLPIFPFAAIAFIASLILRHWGIAWIAWAVLGALVGIAWVIGMIGSFLHKSDS
jgi:hypothetical protein